ncbi:hypothetical protein BU14_0135s0024, partial [Porphyra umbilicalis]
MPPPDALAPASDARPPTIAIDIDEVLAPFLPPLTAWYNAARGTRHALSDYHSYRFADTWGGSDAAATAAVEAWFDTGALGRLVPLPGAAAGLAALAARGARLVVVTSRQAAVADVTRGWVARAFPGVFADVVFGNHWGRTGAKVSKADLCAGAGAVLL